MHRPPTNCCCTRHRLQIVDWKLYRTGQRTSTNTFWTPQFLSRSISSTRRVTPERNQTLASRLKPICIRNSCEASVESNVSVHPRIPDHQKLPPPATKNTVFMNKRVSVSCIRVIASYPLPSTASPDPLVLRKLLHHPRLPIGWNNSAFC